MRSRPLLPQTMQVASVPLGLVSTQAPLIPVATHSAKLRGSYRDCQICTRIRTPDHENGGKGRMHKTN